MSKHKHDVVIKAAKELYPQIMKDLSAQSTKKFNDDTMTLYELDIWKNQGLPRLLKKRYESSGELYLLKEELILLMDWKLAKGKFRPTLPKLIKSNSDESVSDVTKAGLGAFMEMIKPFHSCGWHELSIPSYQRAIRFAIKSLTQLKGVGPATASLILSLLHEVTILSPPFFSDESYMYFIKDSLYPSRQIKYSIKEYADEFVPVLIALSAQLHGKGNPNDLEMGAWSLKIYEIHCFDKLADIKLPFTVNDEDLESASIKHLLEDILSKKRQIPDSELKESKEIKRIKR